MHHQISVTILTKNSEFYLKEVLEALHVFDEVLIYDTGSEDATLEIAKQFTNTVIHERPFIGFGPTHNQASALAKNDWILSIDSDEIVTPELNKELATIQPKLGKVYSFPRHNEYRNKWIKWCGWHPDQQIRLYNRTETAFSNAQVHEAILTENMTIVPLNSPIRHYSYRQVSDFLTKMQSYSDLFATQYQGKKSSSLFKAIAHGSFAFFKSYFLKIGIMGGREGFEISFYNASTAFYKYLKLAEANERLKTTQQKDAVKYDDVQKKKDVSSAL